MESTLTEAPREYQQLIEQAPVETPAPAPSPPQKQQPSKKSSTSSLPSKKPTPAKKPSPPKAKSAVPAPYKKIKAWSPKTWPFGVGETITWNLRYGFIEAGQAVLQVQEPKKVDGQMALHYQGKITSSKVMDLFYKISNQVDVMVAMQTHLPIRHEIQQLESKRWGRRVVLFDQIKQKVKFFQDLTTSEGKKKVTKKTSGMTLGAQDLFSALYFYRFVDPGRNYAFPIHDRWKNWVADLRYQGEEVIHVPAGRFHTHRYLVMPKLEGKLSSRGDVELWVSQDEARVIVQFKAKLKVGSVTGELTQYQSSTPFNQPLPTLLTTLEARK